MMLGHAYISKCRGRERESEMRKMENKGANTIEERERESGEGMRTRGMRIEWWRNITILPSL